VDSWIFEPFINGNYKDKNGIFQRKYKKKYNRLENQLQYSDKAQIFPIEAIRGYSYLFTIANIWVKTDICNGKTKIIRPLEKR
jgi:hypothetical protein